MTMYTMVVCEGLRGKAGVDAGNLIGRLQQYVRASALECEECIFTASGQADAPEEPETTETGTLTAPLTCH